MIQNSGLIFVVGSYQRIYTGPRSFVGFSDMLEYHAYPPAGAHPHISFDLTLNTHCDTKEFPSYCLARLG
jgi:hypothetical protein